MDRCCERHDDWSTLARHLVKDFGGIPEADVLRELGEARRAVESVGLQRDPLLIGELIARNQLRMKSGDQPDAARLDPQRHGRRVSPENDLESA